MATTIVHLTTKLDEQRVQRCALCGYVIAEGGLEAFTPDVYLMVSDRGGGCTSFTPIFPDQLLRLLPIVLEERAVMCDDVAVDGGGLLC